MAAIEAEGLDANVSVKLTGLGLGIDPELCVESVRTLCPASPTGTAGSSASTWRTPRRRRATLDLYRELRAEGHENVGIVAPGDAPADAGRRRRARRPASERPRLQGHLRRAGGRRLPGRRGHPASTSRRRSPRSGRTAPRSPSRRTTTALVAKALELIEERALGHRALRVPAPTRRPRGPGRRARARRAHGADLRALRAEVVRVLAAAASRRTRSSPATSPRDMLRRVRLPRP